VARITVSSPPVAELIIGFPTREYNCEAMKEVSEIIKELESLYANVQQAIGQLNLSQDEKEIAELEKQTTAAGFWNDSTRAAEISQTLAVIQKHVQEWRTLEARITEALELAGLSLEEGTQDDKLTEELDRQLLGAKTEFSRREFELKLSGPYDKNSAIVSVFAGTGGTDAQDWAEMLLRMYLRYGEKVGFKATVLDQSPGEEAGIKSVTVQVDGPFAYGKLKGEKGVHRLVRLSPYNSDNLRQTSFALVDVMPQLESQQQFEIDPKELRIDVYRSGGHGGQSVNTTDSAVRLTHIPTGVVVAIQNERSQLQNKEKAMSILQARLTAMMLEQQKAAVSEIRGENQSAAWGNQIRSYVLHPYTKVKDHRTGAETSQAQDVLDGNIDQFIEAYLQSQIGS
jgi:peptide chain release factor 2